MADAVQTGREHIPTPPLWITIIRGVQFLFNIIVMATAANAASYFYVSLFPRPHTMLYTDDVCSLMAMVCAKSDGKNGLIIGSRKSGLIWK